MSNRPDLLPEQKPQGPPPPRPDRPPPDPAPGRIRGLRRVKTLLWMVVLLLLLSFGTLFVVIQTRPALLGLERIVDQQATSAAIISTADAFSTSFAQTARANQAAALDLQSTRAVLVNQANLLQQTETQQAVNRNTTQTAVALANAQQATQAALDFASTQQALEQAATRVQLDFFATQTALYESFPGATATPLPNLTYLDDSFINPRESIDWQSLPLLNGWAVSSDGLLIAQVPDATLLTTQSDFGGAYTVNVEWLPVAGLAAQYDVLVGMPSSISGINDAAVLLRLNTDGQSLTSAELYRLPGSPFGTAGGVALNGAEQIASTTDLSLPTAQLSLSLNINAATLTAQVNGQAILSVELPGNLNGAIGIQVPEGTRIRRFTVER